MIYANIIKPIIAKNPSNVVISYIPVYIITSINTVISSVINFELLFFCTINTFLITSDEIINKAKGII